MALFSDYEALEAISENGEYYAKIIDHTEKEGETIITLAPYKIENGSRTDLCDVYLRIKKKYNEKSAAGTFVKLFKNSSLADMMNTVIGIEIKMNKEYPNIIKVFEIEEESDNKNKKNSRKTVSKSYAGTRRDAKKTILSKSKKSDDYDETDDIDDEYDSDEDDLDLDDEDYSEDADS